MGLLGSLLVDQGLGRIFSRSRKRVDGQDALAQQFGLAPGQWSIANTEWKGRIRKEPTLGPAMSEIHRRVKKSR